MRQGAGPLGVSEEGRRPGGERSARVPRRNTAVGPVPGRSAGQERGVGARRDRPELDRKRDGRGVLAFRSGRVRGQEIVAGDFAFRVRGVASRHGGHGRRRTGQKGQGRRRADAGRHDDDHHAAVHRVWRTGADGHQGPVDQHPGAHVLGHGGRQKIGPRSCQNHVRSDQRPARLQIGKRGSCCRERKYQNI